MGWFTKTVEVEKVVEKVVERPVPGEASKATIYLAYETEVVQSRSPYYSHSYETPKHLGYYLSCADAFKAHPGCKVKEVTGVRIGSEYFAVYHMTPVTVTKPKREKGKGRAA